MGSKYRRLLNDAQETLKPPLPPLPPKLSATPGNISTHIDAAAAPTQFSPSSMVVTVLVLVLALFFVGFFSIYARKFFSIGIGGRGSDFHYDTTYEYDDVFGYHHRRLFHSSSSTPPLGLDAAAVGSLPLLEYDKYSSGEGGNLLCVVCLSEFEKKETVKLIPSCGHVFHPKCIETWLISRGCCPLCRCSDIRKSAKPFSLRVSASTSSSSSSSSDGTAAAEEEEEDVHHQVCFQVLVPAAAEAEAVRKIGRSSSWSFGMSEVVGEDNVNVLLQRTCSF